MNTSILQAINLIKTRFPSMEIVKQRTMKTAKVQEVSSVKEWNGNNGTVYYHNLIMDNGDKINIGKKKNLSPGDELHYEITEEGQQEFNKAKAVNPEFQQQATKQPASQDVDNDSLKGIKIGHALRCACDIYAAAGCATAPVPWAKVKEAAKEIYRISEELNNEL